MDGARNMEGLRALGLLGGGAVSAGAGSSTPWLLRRAVACASSSSNLRETPESTKPTRGLPESWKKRSAASVRGVCEGGRVEDMNLGVKWTLAHVHMHQSVTDCIYLRI